MITFAAVMSCDHPECETKVEVKLYLRMKTGRVGYDGGVGREVPELGFNHPLGWSEEQDCSGRMRNFCKEHVQGERR